MEEQASKANAENLANKVLGVEHLIKNGDKTPNQVRSDLGLPPLKAHIGDERIISKG